MKMTTGKTSMLLKRIQKPCSLSDQRGSAAIILAMVISGVVTAGIYAFNRQIVQMSRFEQRVTLMSDMSSFSFQGIDEAAQLIQSGVLAIDTTSGTFKADSQALKPKAEGGVGWQFSDSVHRDEVFVNFCNPRSADSSVSSLVGKDLRELNCDEEDRISTKIKVAELQQIVASLADGSETRDSYVLLETTTSMEGPGDRPLQQTRRARVKVPFTSGGGCPFTDPTMNPPATSQPFTAPFYIAVGRAYVGWARIGIPVNQSRAGGYASVRFDRELTRDPNCGSHECNYWAPSTSTEKIRAWQVKIGDLNFGMRLHTPVGDEASCYLTFHPNRRPTFSFNSGCFAPGTMIRMGDLSLKRIEKIEEGDEVYNPVTRSSSTVMRTIAGPEHEPLLEVVTEAASVMVTSKHPFQTSRGLVAARDLKTGDRILRSGGRYEVVNAISKIEQEEPITVYNFEVDAKSESNHAHMVEADGVVTGDLFLQEKVSGVDPTKRPYSPSLLPYKEMLTKLMRAPEL